MLAQDSAGRHYRATSVLPNRITCRGSNVDIGGCEVLLSSRGRFAIEADREASGSAQREAANVTANRIGALLLATLIGSAPAPAADPDWPEAITVATGSPGGTYYVYGEGLANILSSRSRNSGPMLPTDGPSENIELIESGEADRFRDHGRGAAGLGRNGCLDRWCAATLHACDVPMYDTPFHFIVLQDLRFARSPIWPESGSGRTGGWDERHLYAAAAEGPQRGRAPELRHLGRALRRSCSKGRSTGSR